MPAVCRWEDCNSRQAMVDAIVMIETRINGEVGPSASGELN